MKEKGVGMSILSSSNKPDEFLCNICIRRPSNSVVTLCGHIFCWACLYGWMHNKEKPCPVCKNLLTKGTIVPIYGCNEEYRRDGSIPPPPNAPLSLSSDAPLSLSSISVDSEMQDDGEGFMGLLQDKLGIEANILVHFLDYFKPLS